MKTGSARAETATLFLLMQKVNMHFSSKLPASALVAELWSISFKMQPSSSGLNDSCRQALAPRPILQLHAKLSLNAFFLPFDISLGCSGVLWLHLHSPTDTTLGLEMVTVHSCEAPDAKQQVSQQQDNVTVCHVPCHPCLCHNVNTCPCAYH